MIRDRKDEIATEKFNVNKSVRNTMWGKYTKDVIHRGLRDRISFDQYCARMLNPQSKGKLQRGNGGELKKL